METSPPRCKRRLPSPEGGPDDSAAAARAAGLDSLPEELLENIVARLPLRDAVRTSAVSGSWSRRWESTPDLRHYWPRRSRPAAICAVLARYSCDVRRFCTWGIRAEAFPHIDEWLPLLAAKGVQCLTLSFWDYTDVNVEYYTLHPAIFACAQLTSLHLERCFLPTAPEGFAGFPNLTTLNLVYVGLPENGEKKLEAMIRMSPSLVSLELNNVEVTDDDFDDWIIQAPNLERLTIISDIDYGWEIRELPSIQEANINSEDYSIDRDFVKLLTCLAQVRQLEFLIPSTDGNALEGISCSFQKLRNLILHTNFYKASTILSTFGLLTRAPNLKHLEIEITDHENQSDEVDITFFDAMWTNSLFANLDFVSIKSATCWSNEMCFIEFVLSKARVLHEFYIYHDDTGSYSEPREKAINELAKYKRASPKAMVFFRDMEDTWLYP
ncbi:F-box/FBD/LRR-repeat protein At1g13570-like isoform X2 [Oryza brachyantha]|uniref:F-box/FBD/LRR-repeat protein At1g13570-like isoform X2 n=1 Tax=Oryza brachyantha TaxID=4533 RepID=UPI001AD95BAC|nr:F-box/FBD/LRR-repeat protein At1g13570-like isoform X2 [Oryza brachyantha]